MKNFLFVYFLLFCVFTASAQQMLSLQDALKLGIEHSFDIRISKVQSDISHNNNVISNTGILPTLGVDGSYQLSNQNFNQVYATGLEQKKAGAITNSLTGGVEMDWTIFKGLQMYALRSKLNNLDINAQISYRDRVEKVASNIMKAYFQVVNAGQQLEVYEEAIKFSLTRLDLAKTRFDVGSTSKLEYLQSLVDLNADSAAYIRQKAVIRKSKLDLNRTMGVTPTEGYTVSDTIILAAPLQFGELTNKLSSGNLQLILSQNQVKIANDDLHITRSNMFPVVSLMARYNMSNIKAQAGFLTLNQVDGMVYGVTARWNIFNGFNTRRNIQNAKKDIEIAQLSADSTSFNAYTNLNKAFEDYTVAMESLKLEQKNLGIAAQNLDIATERYKIGRTGVLEYRQAQVGYTEAHDRYIQAIFNTKVSEIMLLRLTGQMQNIKE